MTSYFDTSILFPSLMTAHPHHRRCTKLLAEARQEGQVTCLSLHSYAEVYANLTRFPLGDRITPEAAWEALQGLSALMKTITLTEADYQAALSRCAARNLVSGVIYDALHLQAAIQAGAEVLYTANLRDFERLGAGEVVALRGG